MCVFNWKQNKTKLFFPRAFDFKIIRSNIECIEDTELNILETLVFVESSYLNWINFLIGKICWNILLLFWFWRICDFPPTPPPLSVSKKMLKKDKCGEKHKILIICVFEICCLAKSEGISLRKILFKKKFVLGLF